MKLSPELRAIAPKPKKKPKPKEPLPPRVLGDVAFPVFRRAEGLRLERGGNDREQWWQRHARSKREKAATWAALGLYPAAPPFPVDVLITRIAPASLDTDNLEGAGKYIRDAVAHWLGASDGPNDPRIRWHYAQRKAGKGAYHTEIDIRSASAPKRSPLDVLSAWQAKGCPMVRTENPAEVF